MIVYAILGSRAWIFCVVDTYTNGVHEFKASSLVDALVFFGVIPMGRDDGIWAFHS